MKTKIPTIKSFKSKTLNTAKTVGNGPGRGWHKTSANPHIAGSQGGSVYGTENIVTGKITYNPMPKWTKKYGSVDDKRGFNVLGKSHPLKNGTLSEREQRLLKYKKNSDAWHAWSLEAMKKESEQSYAKAMESPEAKKNFKIGQENLKKALSKNKGFGKPKKNVAVYNYAGDKVFNKHQVLNKKGAVEAEAAKLAIKAKKLKNKKFKEAVASVKVRRGGVDITAKHRKAIRAVVKNRLENK